MEMEWIDVIDSLPCDGELVIVSGGVATYAKDTGNWYSQTAHSAGTRIRWEVTAWMHLPELTE